MSLFLISFLLIYGGVNAYALLKARAAFSLGAPATLAAALLLAALVCAPIIVHYLARAEHETAARAAAWIGYCWMGLVFFFFWTNLSLDVANLAARLVNALRGKGPVPLVAYGKGTFLALAALCILLGAYSAWEASRIRPAHVRVVTGKLPPSVSRVRIAQISDTHFGLLNRRRLADTIARIVRESSPDLFVATGDLVDGRLDHLDGLSGTFAATSAPLGKFAVTGNHEFYAGIGRSLDFTRRCGFTVLRGEAVTIGGVLRIVGVDDEATNAPGRIPAPPEEAVLGNPPSPLFTVLLKHRPLIAPGSPGLFDLQLSGHTHDGQIFPFRLLSRIRFPILSGLHDVGKGSLLYASRGTGTWGPPMRFLAPPEVTIIDIER